MTRRTLATAKSRSLLLFVALALPYGARPAMAQITPGVTQSAAKTANVSGTVAQGNAPVGDASITLFGPAVIATRSDARGGFTFATVPYGTYRVVVDSKELGQIERDNIVIKGDLNISVEYPAQVNRGAIKTIASVSTSSAGANINVTPASIASVTPSQYAFEGNTSWNQLLDGIPGVTVSDNAAYGGGSSTAIPYSPFVPAVVSINGALPYETSVTIDGMPFNNVSSAEGAYVGNGVDLSNVPLTTFDTADVVRGPGGNSLSIVDSVGGSLILHAPGPSDGDSFELSISNDPYGGIVENARAALRLGQLSTTFYYGINDSPGPLGNTTGILALTPTPSTLNGKPFFGCSSAGAPCSIENPTTPTYQFCYCTGSSALLIGGIPLDTAWSSYTYGADAAYNVTRSVTAEVFYAGSATLPGQVTGLQFPIDFSPGMGYAGSVEPGTHFFNDQFLGAGASNGQSSHLLEEKVTAYTGKGVLRIAALQNYSYQEYRSPNLLGLPNGTYPVWGVGYLGSSSPGSRESFNGTPEQLTFPTLPYFESIWSNSRDLLISYAEDLGASSSFGISDVSSFYNGPITYTLGTIGGGTPPAASEMTNEVRVHLTTTLWNKLFAEASWYFALGSYHVPNPNGAGDYVNPTFPYNAPRLGLAWRPQPNIAIRAAAGGGFALPQLRSLLGSSAPFCSGGICTVSPPNLNLKPEQSFGMDVGTDVRLDKSSVLSLDVYQTKLFGQFFQYTQQSGEVSGLPLFLTETNNLSESRYEGINLDLRHEPSRGYYWHFALGLSRAYIVSVPAGFYDGVSGYPPTPCTNCENTYLLPGQNFDGQGVAAVPYANGSAALGFRFKPNTYVEINPTYYGNGNPYYQPAFVEFDAHGGYAVTPNVSLFATFSNIFGIHGQGYGFLVPTIGAPTVSGQQPYPLFGIPYGPRSLILTLNFKAAQNTEKPTP